MSRRWAVRNSTSSTVGMTRTPPEPPLPRGTPAGQPTQTGQPWGVGRSSRTSQRSPWASTTCPMISACRPISGPDLQIPLGPRVEAGLDVGLQLLPDQLRVAQDRVAVEVEVAPA